MPHVWMVNHHASAPREVGAGHRHFELARALLAHDWTSSIIAASTDHVTGRQRVEGCKLASTVRHDDVAFRWLRVPRYRSSAGRLVNMVAFLARVVGPRATHDLTPPDLIIGSTVHPLAALGASVLARRNGVPFIFEIRDLWPETLIDMQSIPRHGMVASLLRRLERLLCERAALVITTMPHARDYLTSEGVPAEKIQWISNGIRADDFPAAPAPPSSGAFRFMYMGAMGRANALDTIVTAFIDARLRDAVLELVGDGPSKASLVDIVRERGAQERVLFSPPVPRQDVASVAARSHCLVAAVRDLPLYRFGISLNKLFEYMAMTRPVLFIGHAASNPVEAAGGGVCVDSGRAAEAFREVRSTAPDVLQRWGAANRVHVMENYDYARLARRLADTMSLVDSQPASRRRRTA